jgi:Ca-activated chloride channel family protein
MVALVAAVVGVLVGLALVGLDVLPVRTEGTASATAPTSAVASEPATDCTADEKVSLVVAAAPEITTPLRRTAGDVAGTGELRCVDIEVAAVPPPTARAALGRGWDEDAAGPAPDVWIPTTSTEVSLAAAGGVDGVVDTAAPSIARSPSVIAMPQPMADVLGWPDAPLSWESITELAAEDDAWAERDRRQWGPFRISLVEGVGAEPTIGALGALTDAVGALPTDAAQQSDDEHFQARAQLLLLERKVEYLGATDQHDELLQTVSALPLTEQMVWRYNGGGDNDTVPDTPLAAWYPADGPPDADYPYVQLDAPWTDAASSDAAAAFLRAIESPDGRRNLQAAGFRDESRDTTPELIDADGLRPDLATAAPDPVVPDIVVGPLMQAWRGLSQTGNLLAVVDVSGSMKTEVPGTGASRLDLSKQGLEAGIALTDPASSAGLWEFSTNLGGTTDHRVLVPLGPLGEEVREGVTRQEAEIATIRELEPRADTGLYDTIAASYEHMVDNYELDQLNAVIFFTDGKNDDADGISLQELRRRLRDLVDPHRPVLFIGVAYGAEADFEVLESVTKITGGKLYELERPDDIQDVFIDVQTGGVAA